MLDMILFDLMGQASIMSDVVQPVFRSIDSGALATLIKNSPTYTPIAGSVHLLALALLGGCIVLADLRLIGPGIEAQSPQELNRKMAPFLTGAVIVLILSGTVLALGEMMRLYASPPYWLKMASLVSALVFTFMVRDPVIRAGGKISPVVWVGLALSMLVFWISWINLTDWFFGARQAYIVFALVLAGFVVWGGIRKEKFPLSMRLVAAMSIFLWGSTAISGRWIAFW
jgi:hypothetical protein